MRKKTLSFLSILLTVIAPSVWADTSSEDLHCLALNVYHEARGEPVEGQLAVAMVTMNRVQSGNYPSTVCGVVWQRRQFSWTHDGKSDRPDDERAWELATKIAEFVYNKYELYHNTNGGALDLTKGALNYYAPKLANPKWAEIKDVTGKIGGHVFLKSAKKNSNS